MSSKLSINFKPSVEYHPDTGGSGESIVGMRKIADLLEEHGAVKELWNSPKIGIPLWLGGASLTIYWLLCVPPPGYAIGALAVVAGVMSVRDIKSLGRIVWVVLLVCLLITEFRAIGKDRANSEEEQKKFFETQKTGFQGIATQSDKNFKETAKGLEAAVTTSQQEFDATMRRSNSILKSSKGALESSREGLRTTQENFAYSTGADTFCYLGPLVFEGSGGKSDIGALALHKVGPYPLYGVTMVLSVIRPFASGTKGPPSPGSFVGDDFGGKPLSQFSGQQTRVAIGDLPAEIPLATRTFSLDQFALQGQSILEIDASFTAKNGIWHELMFLWKMKGPPLEALPKTGPFANAIDARDPK